jgi:chromosome partitioning protein
MMSSSTRTIAIVNRKGGVGKTSTTISLGAALARRGRRVLLVDLDSQQSLATSLRVAPPSPGLADVLLSEALLGTGKLAEAIVKIDGMFVASGEHLTFVESKLSTYSKRAETVLKVALARHDAPLDYVLVDCAPAISFLNIAALIAATDVLIPVQAEFLALAQLSETMMNIETLRAKANPDMRITGLVPTLYDGRNLHSREVLEQIAKEACRYNVKAFKPIPRNVRMAEAPVSGTTIFDYAPQCPAARAYSDLAEEIDH